ncbi:hypothetical protein HW555_005165 [Spodoptera exigua]|uniref:Uncharacterized protein n=1 Tax=Spodoptera exigua TaxID=7107 RepID=A0A835LBG5_SPOEX|nr:hypothetical protein HW555_005165 [Spodoptera exigua]
MDHHWKEKTRKSHYLQGKVKRSSDAFINSMNYGGTVTFGEQGVADCLAAGNPYWKCYTEQSGINPEWR